MKKQNESRTRRQISIICLMTISLFFSARLSAQIPYRTITDGCEWSVSDEKYMILGDTIINGVTYMKVYSQKSNQPFEFNPAEARYFTAIRNDSVNKKVYCNMPAGTRIVRNNNEIGRTEEPQEVFIVRLFPVYGGYSDFLYSSYRHKYGLLCCQRGNCHACGKLRTVVGSAERRQSVRVRQ